MFFTSKREYLSDNAREINIGDDCNLPQLHRLNADFGFIVLGLNESSSTPKQYVLCEAGIEATSQDDIKKVTPEFHSLSELESHVAENVVDILNRYLFGEDSSLDMPMVM